MNAASLKIAHNETRRYITIIGDGDVSAEDAIKFATDAMRDFGIWDAWVYVEFHRVEHYKVVVVFERKA